MDSMQSVTGVLVDSWVERPKRRHDALRVVLQVAPLGRPGDLMIVEAAASLVPDRGWLQDLGENMCHGSPVAAVGRLLWNGLLDATEIRLDR
jgi:hypothetical protein